MATWAELTDEQRAVYQAFERTLRATAGEQARTNNHWQALNEAYGAIQAMGLDTAEVVPNSSGLAGSESLTAGEMVSIVAHAQGILTNYNTLGHRQLWAQAVGVQNMMG